MASPKFSRTITANKQYARATPAVPNEEFLLLIICAQRYLVKFMLPLLYTWFSNPIFVSIKVLNCAARTDQIYSSFMYFFADKIRSAVPTSQLSSLTIASTKQ